MSLSPYKIKHIIAGVVMTVMTALTARALPADTYAQNSRLSEGNWVKISVTESGIHFISASQLRQLGFSAPATVKVFGYGAGRISDLLDATTYVDDLPVAPMLATERGIFFYAVGPVNWYGPDSQGHFWQRNNPWTTVGYYYLSDAEADTAMPEGGAPLSGGGEAVTTFTDYTGHETDLVSPGESGHLLVGEDFRYTPQQNFTFDLPGRVEGTSVWSQCRFYSLVPSTQATLTLSANNRQLTPAKKLPVSSSTSYGDTSVVAYDFDLTGNRLTLALKFAAGTTVRMANLNSLTVNYTRSLDMGGRSLLFNTASSAVTLSGADASTHVWDITDPQRPSVMRTSQTGSSAVSWLNDFSGPRRYAAFSENATSLPSPVIVGRVSNQNLHGEEVPDMVIVSAASLLEQAERVADLHRQSPDSMRVLVISQEKVYNEFGSGSPDVNAIRRMAKMFYDRGEQNGHHFEYLLLFGRPTFDNRHLTEVMRTSGYESVPIWMTDAGHNESSTYSTDDFLAMLEDSSGKVLGAERHSIAVGRIPSRSVSEAKDYVDKLIRYVNKPVSGDWKNKFVILADDQDNGIHLEQAETFVSDMQNSASGADFMYNKVYVDAYEKIGGVTVDGRKRMYKLLDEGAAWWTYIGHASIDSWTAEKMLTRNDLINNLYFRHLPILYAATCSFSRFDSTPTSGAEMMLNNTGGGVIASICPVRPVYISSNGVFTRQVARAIMGRNPDGRFKTVGQIFRDAKNGGSTDANRLRYVLIGDPALRVPTPDNRIVLSHVGDEEVSADEPPTIKARQRLRLHGYLTDYAGNRLKDFTGSVHLSIYDAEESIVTLGRGTADDPGKQSVFDQQGTRLWTGCDSVVNGEFTISVAMPNEIAGNYRPAAVNMYAVSADSRSEAMGQSRDIYVYGLDESAMRDEEPPVIEALYLNHETFRSGDVVNESPMMFARVSDNIGINLSQAGIGHTLWMKLDDDETFTDVSDYYTPDNDGNPSGTVTYPFENLTKGNHTLTLRIWDTDNNMATSSIDFYVEQGLPPTLYDVWTDTNPATTQANFYVSHNRPDATLEVTVTVYDLMGRPVWSQTQRGRSDMFTSAPLTWNLTDGAGRRVSRGIYLYRAEVSTDGEHTSTASKRIAVTGQR